MDMIALFAAVTVMGAIIAGMMAIYQTSASPRSNLQRRLGTLLSESSVLDSAVSNYQTLRDRRVGQFPVVGQFLMTRTWTDDVALRLEQADIKLTVSEYVSARIFVALILGAVPILYFGQGLPGYFGAVALALVGYMVPSFYVSFARGRRVSKLTNQLIEALSLISNSLKAGFGLMQAMDLASRELSHPISTELKRILHDINVGMRSEEALTAFAKRSGSEDLDIVITAMVIQQSTGGNLAEILDNVAHTMRERIRIRGEIKTLTTQQLLTGYIIGGMPVAMLVLFSMINPAYVEPLFKETIGNLMLVAAGVMELFGVAVIRKILSIEV